ncbi:hypothetical protein GPJ56_000931 [Histomonas meleagridis]|uniref:uncharacterized protein n=1 Tax=Histomonas meleagridis TaxID=135588 RepID=UPI003559A58C|nr:hypothetical protein GPJ56_000931 [Histomonas meleagridis]KAH0803766.1 hypothetical protein GO595_002596 [Histomonas meleagridis]
MRKLAQSEKIFLDSYELMQFAVGVNDSKVIPKIINNLIKSIIGFRLKTDGNNLIAQDNKVTVHSLPNSIKNAYEASIYIDNHYRPDFSKEFATIAANDKFVSVNSSHGFTDGGFFKNLIRNILNDNLNEVKGLPITPFELFSNEIQETIDDPSFEQDTLKVSRFPFSHTLPETPSTIFRRDINDVFPIEEHKWYNKSTGKLSGLTESLWLSIALASETLNNVKRPLKVGCLTCVDLRPFINPRQKTVSENAGNNFTSFGVVADNVNEQMTIREAGKQLRNNFNRKTLNGAIFNSLKPEFDYGGNDNENILVELSNVGPMEFKDPINDVWVQQSMKSKIIERTVTLTSFSMVGSHKNLISNRLQYSPTTVSDEAAQKISNSISYFMKNISPDVTIREAMELMRHIQNPK